MSDKKLRWLGGAVGIGSVIGVVLKVSDFYNSHYYHRDGFNNNGFDRDGFDRDGFDAGGYDRDGLDHNGFDRRGYSKEGFNSEGFDKRGFNREGRDKCGYDRDGFDISGRDRKGYDRNGWNEHGRDLTGHDAVFYASCASDLEKKISKAQDFVSSRDYEHAALEVRKGAELVVKCVISHTKGLELYRSHLNVDIDSCKNVLSEEMIGKLHSLRKICSGQMHIDEPAYENLHDQLYFCKKTLEEATAVVRQYASYSSGSE